MAYESGLSQRRNQQECSMIRPSLKPHAFKPHSYSLKFAVAALSACFAMAPAAFAQAPASEAAPQAVGAAALVHVQARVVEIDADSNSVALQGPRGNVAVLDVNPAVADVKKLHVGDIVNIAYQKAVLIGVDKLATKGIRQRVDTEIAQPASGGVVASARRVEVVATVQKIDRKHRTVTLRGPTRTETLDVAPDIELDKLKVGDSVRAVFVTAVAASVARNGADVK
jgi:Cu/Ag efflux protein CusF